MNIKLSDSKIRRIERRLTIYYGSVAAAKPYHQVPTAKALGISQSMVSRFLAGQNVRGLSEADKQELYRRNALANKHEARAARHNWRTVVREEGITAHQFRQVRKAWLARKEGTKRAVARKPPDNAISRFLTRPLTRSA